MKTLMTSDTYTISFTYPLDGPRRKCLYLLYQPLIGGLAVNVYMTFMEDCTLDSTQSLHSRLLKTLQVSLEQLQESMRKLQAVGLLKVFYKENQYHYELSLPFTPSQFYNHQVLNTLLLKIVGNEEYLKTRNHFLMKVVDNQGFEEQKVMFHDVFDIQLLNEQKVLHVKDPVMDLQKTKLQETYPIDIFFEGMASYQITPEQLTKQEFELIDQIGMLYSIPLVDMQAFVKENFIQGKFHEEAFLKTCRSYYNAKVPTTFKEIYHTQSIKYASSGGTGAQQVHIEYLESVSPYELLKSKYGGKEPVKRELQLLEYLLTTLQLEQGVMNVLIEFTLAQCDGALPQKYMEYHGAKWKRKDIKTVQEAMTIAKQEATSNTKAPTWQIDTTSDTLEEVDSSSLEELLAKYN